MKDTKIVRGGKVVREAQPFHPEDNAYYLWEATIKSALRLAHEQKRGCVDLRKTLRTAGSIRPLRGKRQAAGFKLNRAHKSASIHPAASIKRRLRGALPCVHKSVSI